MRRGKVFLAFALAALTALVVAGCGQKIDNIEQIDAEYVVEGVLANGKDKIYPAKSNVMELEQIYTAWHIRPKDNVTVSRLSFTVQPIDSMKVEDATSNGSFTVELQINNYDADEKGIKAVYRASQPAVFNSRLTFEFPEVTFEKGVPKEFREKRTIDLVFKTGGEINGSVKFKLSGLELGT